MRLRDLLQLWRALRGLDLPGLLAGWKTYLAAAGLALLALAELAGGDAGRALHYALEALGLFGIRAAVARADNDPKRSEPRE